MNLNSNIEILKIQLSRGLQVMRYDGYIFAALMFLSILGVGITDASTRISHWYWLCMVPIFCASCLYLEWQSSLDSGIPAKTIIIKQLQHWLGVLASFYLAFFLRGIGSLDNQSTGLVLLLILALSTFLAGVTMGWLFRLLGMFLGLCLVLVAYMENYIGVIIALSVAMLVLYRFLVKASHLVTYEDE
jgi:hypothetical protein